MSKRRIASLAIGTAFYVCSAAGTLSAWQDNTPKRSVLVVRPKGWEGGLEEWKRYRSGEYQVVEIDSIPDSNKLHIAILEAASRCNPPAVAVMLCSDVACEVPSGPASDPKKGNPQFQMLTPGVVLNTTVQLGHGMTPTLCTDAVYGDLDNDGCPDLAVGRIPAKSPEELSKMLHRSLAYEASNAGPWFDRVHVTAGVGGFGVIADTAIETVTRRFLTEGLPDHFQLNMTYATCNSVYCPDPSQFRETYIQRINQGGLFWVYIGHGSVTHLDHFQVGDEWRPIGNSEDADRFQIPNGQPIAMILACFTGAYDAKTDCFAERLLQQDSGPIAVIAGSRVTMPYGMSQLASEMIDGCFRDQVETLGELVLQAKRNVWQEDATDKALAALAINDSAEMDKDASKNDPAKRSIRRRYQGIITQMAQALSPPGHELLLERREHVRLMNLLGDPLLKIPHPKQITVQCPDQGTSGGTLPIQGVTPLAGKMMVKLSLVRDRLPEHIKPVVNYDGRPEQNRAMQANYEASNNLVVASKEIEVTPGSYETKIDIPGDLKGRCIVATYIYDGKQWAVGSHRIAIRKPK